jgi:hypothetical protein
VVAALAKLHIDVVEVDVFDRAQQLKLRKIFTVNSFVILLLDFGQSYIDHGL